MSEFEPTEPSERLSASERDSTTAPATARWSTHETEYRETVSVNVDSIDTMAVGTRTFALGESDGSVYLLGEDWVQTPPFDDLRDIAVGSYPHVLADGELQRFTPDGVALRSFEVPDAVAVAPLLDRDAVAVISPNRVVFLDEESYRERASAPLPVPATESSITGGFASVAFATETTLTWITLDETEEVTAYQKEFQTDVSSVGFVDDRVVALTDQRGAGYQVETGTEQWADSIEGVCASPRGRSRLLLVSDSGTSLLAADGTVNHVDVQEATLATPNRWRVCRVTDDVVQVEQRPSTLSVYPRQRPVSFDTERHAELSLVVENIGEETLTDTFTLKTDDATLMRDSVTESDQPTEASLDVDLTPGERSEAAFHVTLHELFTDELVLQIARGGDQVHSTTLPVEVPRHDVSLNASITNINGGDATVQIAVQNTGDAPASNLELSLANQDRTISLPTVEPMDKFQDTITVEVSSLDSGSRELRVVDTATNQTHESTLRLPERLLELQLSIDEGDATTDPIAQIGVSNCSGILIKEELGIQYAGRQFTQTLHLQKDEAGYVCVPLVGALPTRFTVSVTSRNGLFETQRQSIDRPSPTYISRTFEIDGEGPYNDLTEAHVGQRITESVTVSNRSARQLTGIRVEYPSESVTLGSISPRERRTVQREYVLQQPNVELPASTVYADDNSTELPSVPVAAAESVPLVTEPKVVLGKAETQVVVKLRNTTDQRCRVTGIRVGESNERVSFKPITLGPRETKTISDDLPSDILAKTSGPMIAKVQYRVERETSERNQTLPVSVEIESDTRFLKFSSIQKHGRSVDIDLKNASEWCLRDIIFNTTDDASDATCVVDKLEPRDAFEQRIEDASRRWGRRRFEYEFAVRATLDNFDVQFIQAFKMVGKQNHEDVTWNMNISVDIEDQSAEPEGLLAFSPTVQPDKSRPGDENKLR